MQKIRVRQPRRSAAEPPGPSSRDVVASMLPGGIPGVDQRRLRPTNSDEAWLLGASGVLQEVEEVQQAMDVVHKRIEAELALYEEQASLPLTSCPLQWWRQFEIRGNIMFLSRVAQYAFSIPVSTARC